MPRLRRKYIIVVSATVLLMLLLIYFLINQGRADLQLFDASDRVASAIKSPSLINIPNHDVQVPVPKIETNLPNEIQLPREEGLDFPDTMNNVDITFRNEKPNSLECEIQADRKPKPDIQMLGIYDSLKFDNPDGGVWKQGWKLDYDQHEWNSHHKLRVFVVPHSHNDPGWVKTFDEYYQQTTRAILNNMLTEMTDNPATTFIWAEISYFSKWFEEIPIDHQRMVKSLVRSGRLEFVSGGWVMTDEANSHWMSMLVQLTEGHVWLKSHLNVTPTSSWAIDPFGHSATLPFILKKSGFENHLIQRTHYAVKKRLAQQKQLEFRWQQLWDTTGSTELFTHMMPFYSYDIPHTCGPDPKICCQFDFKRLPHYGLSCPWKVPPKIIDETNVAARAELILDQWRKKSTLFRTNSLLIPLGDDFRYNQKTEWESQRVNYEKLFTHMNNEPHLNVVAKFGTLQEFFDSVHSEQKASSFPALSGDFFTYADRDHDYWSGYFTTRPFHKRLDRILMTYLRSAEMLYAWTPWDVKAQLDAKLRQARRAHSLFQHHDGITGTAKDHVVMDYARQLNEALKACQFVIQQSVYRHLTKPTIYQPDFSFHYFNIDDSRSADQMSTRHTIILGPEIPTKYVVMHNSLPQIREELVEFLVSKPFVRVTTFGLEAVPSQVSPVWTWHNDAFGTISPQVSNTKFKLMFRAKVAPLGLTTYVIHSTDSVEESTQTHFAKVTIHAPHSFPISLPEYPLDIEFSKPAEVSLHIDGGPRVAFTKHGTIKSMSLPSDRIVPIHLSFAQYNGEESGAYLFIPTGGANLIDFGAPTVIVVRGSLEASCSSGLPFAVHENVLRGGPVEIRNLVDIRPMGNTEIVMRLLSGIRSNGTFYTDLNGLQLVRRQRLKKLPLQGNYYPVPSQIFIEDEHMRLTLLLGQPLGGSSLESGQMEVMQDRRLKFDDNRGVGQGIQDNQPVLNMFRLLLEDMEPCAQADPKQTNGFLTTLAHSELQTLLYPLEKLIWHANDWTGVQPEFGANREPLDVDMQVAVLRDLPHVKRIELKSRSDQPKMGSSLGLVVHRTSLLKCKSDANLSGSININGLLGTSSSRSVHSSLLTMLQRGGQVDGDQVDICPMDMKAFILNR